ncbi:hypothetical protein V9T40_010100 [Parthenolecanium corni]|uniref:HEAT repeat-containing protein 1 n=1 Tax=Parthenolecanium corni TaxID=536013 RepID=A0AAN9Y6B1_9HEMI
MAHTSLAEQLRKLATPQTNVLFRRETRPSLLFHSSGAAEIDRVTFYEIGIIGMNELKEVNEVFEEFRTSLFVESSKNFERAVEMFDVNHKLNKIIKRFLYLASPYFLIKSTQKAFEWLIVRFHINEYNTNELICSTLPYHGTRLFARLIQVLDLKKSNSQWQWLYPLQKKGVPLSKSALLNHCASDVNFLKMICDLTVDAVKIFEPNSSKLYTLFGFYSITVIGTIQTVNEVTKLHLTHVAFDFFRIIQ